MTGGSVSGNTAYLGEGGGIYIHSRSKNNVIKCGSITSNETHTFEDLGGGGIYVESNCYLKLDNVLVTGNYAQGLGGGLAACVHGKISMVEMDSMGIYGNTTAATKDNPEPEKTVYVNSSSMHIRDDRSPDFIDSYEQWKENADFITSAADVFSAGNKAEYNNNTGAPGAIVGNRMLGGGLSNWRGWNLACQG